MAFWQIVISLGVPGLAFGVLYMLFRTFDWKLPAVPKVWTGPLLLVFMLLTATLVFTALWLWAPGPTPLLPQNNPDDSKVPFVEFEIVDSSTGDRIYQTVDIYYRMLGAREQSIFTRNGLGDRPIQADFDDIEVQRVQQLQGYSWRSDSFIDDPKKRRRTLKCDRGPDFQKWLRSKHSPAHWRITEADYTNQMNLLSTDLAEPPQLICLNSTECCLDIFFRRYHPLGVESRFVPTWYPSTTCNPSKRPTTVHKFANEDPEGYFYIYASRNGLPGNLVASGNLFRFPISLLSVYPDNASDGSDEQYRLDYHEHQTLLPLLSDE